MKELSTFLTGNPDWANAIAAIASTAVALLAFVVSAISLYVAHATLKHQRRHNVLSVTPIPHVSVGDYEDRITVRIRNDGTGPLIVKRVSVEDGNQVENALIDWMPALPDGMYWITFVGEMSNRSIAQGREVILLELEGDASDPIFASVRDVVRVALSPLTINIAYTDVYQSRLNPCQKELSWFGRHFA
jgi:hypothetical protein